MRSAKAERGYTMIELVLALGVSMIVIAGALALATAQQRTFTGTSRDRALQEGTRVALGQITDSLRDAGFGVDPALAFDLGPTIARADRISGNFAATPTPLGDGSDCKDLCRDSTTGPDEIVFYSRDPSFGPHPLTVAATASSTSLRVALVPGQTNFSLHKGQVLQVICYTRPQSWAYVTASGEATDNEDGTATVPIATGSAPGTTFPNQTSILDDPCFTAVATMKDGVVDATTMDRAPKIFKVDRYHYYVQAYDAAGNAVAWNTAGSRPYLMLDQGLYSSKDVDGKVTYEHVTSVVAPDVEDLQFEYVFPYDTAAPLVGSTPGVPLSNDDAGINLAPADGAPTYSDAAPPMAAPQRKNHHPGNIGAVRVSAVVRSGTPDTAIRDAAIPACGNRDEKDGDPGYMRVRVETTVRVPNLSSQAPYFPPYGAAGSRTLNVGGG